MVKERFGRGKGFELQKVFDKVKGKSRKMSKRRAIGGKFCHPDGLFCLSKSISGMACYMYLVPRCSVTVVMV
jgi:hypothetical protein